MYESSDDEDNEIGEEERDILLMKLYTGAFNTPGNEGDKSESSSESGEISEADEASEANSTSGSESGDENSSDSEESNIATEVVHEEHLDSRVLESNERKAAQGTFDTSLNLSESFGVELVSQSESESDSDNSERTPKNKKRRKKDFLVTAQRYFLAADKSSVCLQCGQFGHQKNRCPQRYDLCFTCGRMGHQQRRCPNDYCRGCGQLGHRQRDCNTRKRLQLRCSRCGSMAHNTEYCPQERQLMQKFETEGEKSCANCGEQGHTEMVCKAPRFRFYLDMLRNIRPEEVYYEYVDAVRTGRRNSVGYKRNHDNDRRYSRERSPKRRRLSTGTFKPFKAPRRFVKQQTEQQPPLPPPKPIRDKFQL